MPDEHDINQGVTNTATETAQEDHAASQSQNPPVQDTSEDSQPGDEQNQSGEDLTSKGTKVAKEPESRFYQELKNENADMRRLLGDPKALKEYLRDVEGTPTPEQGKEDDLSKLVEGATLPNGQVDALKLAQLMEERLMKKFEEGMQHNLKNFGRSQKMSQTYESDKMSVYQDHPELDPNNKERFDPELDQFIGERFVAQGGLEGKVTLKQVADATFAYLEKQRGQATANAQTEIVRKRAGALPSQAPAGDGKDDEANLSAEETLARRVRNAVTRRN